MWYLYGDTKDEVVPTHDISRVAKVFEDEDYRKVRVTELPGNITVSTVFLMLDHGWGGGEPVLWETMVFGGSFTDALDEYTRRYTSYADAVKGHEEVVKELLA